MCIFQVILMICELATCPLRRLPLDFATIGFCHNADLFRLITLTIKVSDRFRKPRKMKVYFVCQRTTV